MYCRLTKELPPIGRALYRSSKEGSGDSFECFNIEHPRNVYKASCTCLYAEDYTCTRLQQQFKLQNPAWILLFGRGSIKRTVQQKGNKSIYQKRAIGSHRHNYLPSYTLCSVSTLNTIKLYNRNGTQYSLSKQQIARSCSHSPLFAWNKHAQFVCVTDVR